MAKLDLSQANQAVDMSGSGLVKFSAYIAHSPSLWQWLTPAGNKVDVVGTTLTFDNLGHASGGNVVSTHIYLDNNVSNNKVQIFEIDAVAEPLDNNAESFWRMLEGDDTIAGPSATVAGSATAFTIFGDNIIARSGIALGGNDVFTDGGAKTTMIGDVVDVGSQAPETVAINYHGGNDVFFGSNTTLQQSYYGDVLHVNASGKLMGGNDVILLNSSGSGSQAIGDAQSIEGVAGRLAVLIGAGDIIDATGSLGTFLELVGDVSNQGAFANVKGGGDIINGSNQTDTIVGDVHNQGGSETVGGADILLGNGGNDNIVGDVFNVSTGILFGGNDLIHGGSGDDYIFGEFANGPAPSVSGGNDQLFGDEGNDRIFGQTGNDILDGGAGDDSLNGGDGFDFASYISATVTGVTADLINGAINTGDAAGDLYALIEGLSGSTFADSLRGNNLANTLLGQAGTDVLLGRGGNDRILGGDDRDVVTGGLGTDTMTGDSGNDRFDFNSITESGASANTRDHITDFTHGQDKMDFLSMDARASNASNDAFIFIGSATFTAEGQIRATQSGADTVIEINVSGVIGAEMSLVLDHFTASTLTVSDFIL